MFTGAYLLELLKAYVSEFLTTKLLKFSFVISSLFFFL